MDFNKKNDNQWYVIVKVFDRFFKDKLIPSKNGKFVWN